MACPRRGVVLAAKATVTATVLFGVALATCFLAWQVGTVMLPAGYAPGRRCRRCSAWRCASR